jgi:muramidase (phage lysozyme)
MAAQAWTDFYASMHQWEFKLMSPAMKTLLDAIRKHEAPKGYGQIYGGARGVSKMIDCSKYTVDQVLALQTKMLAAGSKSTACAGYQFLKRTLITIKAAMNLSGNEVMTPDLQDRMARWLMERRGLNQYMNGTMTAEAFCNKLAQEWASLPVVTAIKGAHRRLQPGQSYYAGDGLNKAFHDPMKFLAMVRALRS